MEMLTAMVVIQNLHCRGKQRLDVRPDPLCPIGDHTQAHLSFRNQARGLNLAQGLGQLLIALHLMPTQ
jgi:hypothetical protein